MPNSSLIVRKLGTTRLVLLASADYLRQRGVPLRLDDLKRHDCVVFGPSLDDEVWHLQGPKSGGTCRCVDFIGTGNQVEETGVLLIGALILALVVYRARRVFLAQIAAEAEREAERSARERIALTLGRYVPEAIARRLIADETALAPQVRHGAVLVMDIQGFTAFAAERDPAEVIETLNAFLSRCAETISAHDGVVVSFTGDGLLGAFNTPLELAKPEAAALSAASALTRCTPESGFAVRVGIAAGPIAAGSVGSSQRQAFTIYGDTVNRAARLEALAKELGETVLVDAEIARARPGERPHPVGSHDLKGLSAPVAVWSLSTGPGSYGTS